MGQSQSSQQQNERETSPVQGNVPSAESFPASTSAPKAVATAIRAIPASSRAARYEDKTSSSLFGSPLVSPDTPLQFQKDSSSGNLATTPHSKIVSTVLTWTQGGHDVQVATSYDNWTRRIPLSRSREDFTTVMELPPGHHSFRFYVDGEWRTSPEMPTIPDENGNLVNYLEISESGTWPNPADDPTTECPAESPSTVVFTKEMPAFEPNDKEPPLLPPHLNKVILNAESVSDTDPSALPIPHNVMLNHLYALSIRDGVMVLATTHRYRHKYVTSIIYKPVFT